MIKVKEEFKKLIPPLTSEEYQQLEKNCIAEGIREPIIIWNEFIIDGHNRYEIANKHNLVYKTIEKKFNDENAVKEWMILNQFGRRNLSNYQRSVLALQLEEVFKEKGKEKQIEAGGAVRQKSDKAVIDTKKELANIANVSHDTIAKVKVIEAKAAPEVKAKLATGEVSINQVYQQIRGEEEKKNHYAQVAEKIKANDLKPQSEINEIIAQEFNVQDGDIYLINDRHILIVADAYKDKEYILNNCPKINCVLADPPYGVSYKSPTGNGLTQRGDYKIIEGDDKEFDPNILFEYSNNVITWGANHYANKLKNSPGWLIWDKRDGEAINNNSDCEMAWSNMLGSARLWHHKWNGMIKDSERGEKRIHPTQKPIKLYEWCIEITKAGKVIIDPFAGSGIIIPACHNTERIGIAIEKDFTYAAAILNRMIGLGYKVNKK